MFFIYADNKLIYQPINKELLLVSPKLTLELGKAGSVSFKIPTTNKYYDSLKQLVTLIRVEMDDDEIFRGRILTNTRSFNMTRDIYCEGDLSYLVDSVQNTNKFVGKAHDFFRAIIAEHNRRVESKKRFTVGNITVENRDILLSGKSDEITDAETGKIDYKQVAINATTGEWPTTFDFIETCLIDTIGGYLQTRRIGDVTYIDWLADDSGASASQSISFGKNLLDFTDEGSPDDIFSVLIPIGNDNLTIASVNGGSDELVDSDAVVRYGRIVKTHVFDSVVNPSTLLEDGQRYLQNHSNIPDRLTVKAVDLHLIDQNIQAIFVGDRVRVVSEPHGIDKVYTCTKIEYDLENPANNVYTFGIPNRSLTERYRKDKIRNESESSGRSSGGAGGASEATDDEIEKQLDEFFDAWINVDKETATVNLGAVYRKLENAITVLEQNVGISMDAPAGNVNINNLRQEFNDAKQLISSQDAKINLVNNDLGAKIDLITALSTAIDGREQSHYAGISSSVTELESKVESNTQLIATMDGYLTDNSTRITQLSDALNAQIALEASHNKTLSDGLRSAKSDITAVANDLQSQITLEASFEEKTNNSIASLVAKADALGSALILKADQTTIDSRLTTINGRLKSAEADIDSLTADVANVATLIANSINAITLDSLIAKSNSMNAKTINASIQVSSPIVRATTGLYLAGKIVATQEYVKNYLANNGYATQDWCTTTKRFATQDWVNSKGFLTAIPSSLEVSTLAVSGSLRINGYAVATQSWVTEQLKNYSKSGHTHNWGDISGKPTAFNPTSHRHTFSGSANAANGHTHKVSVGGTTYTTQGVSTNVTHNITISGNTGYTGG